MYKATMSYNGLICIVAKLCLAMSKPLCWRRLHRLHLYSITSRKTMSSMSIFLVLRVG